MQKYRNQIVVGLMIALGIYLVMMLVLDSQSYTADAEGLATAFGRFDGSLVIVLVLCQLGVVVFRWIEWHYYLGVVGASMSRFHSLLILIAGFTLVVSPGKAAELLKALLVRVRTGVPAARVAPVVLAERVIDGLAVIIIMVLALAVAGPQISLGRHADVDYDTLSRGIIYTAAALLGFGLIVVQIAPLAYFFLDLLKRLPLLRRVYHPLLEFYESSREIFRLRHVIPMTVVGTGVYFCSALGFYYVLVGFGLEATWTLFLQAAFMVGVTSAIGALSFVPNGAGITEISNVGLLMAFLAPQEPQMTLAVATAASLLQGFFHKWLRVLLGMVTAFAFQRQIFGADLEQAIAEQAQQVRPATIRE